MSHTFFFNPFSLKIIFFNFSILEDIFFRIVTGCFALAAIGVVAVPITASRLDEGKVARAADSVRREGLHAIVLRRYNPLPESCSCLALLWTARGFVRHCRSNASSAADLLLERLLEGRCRLRGLVHASRASKADTRTHVTRLGLRGHICIISCFERLVQFTGTIGN